MFTAIRARRALAGGIALAAGTAAVAAPAVAPPLAADPLDDADVSPSVNGDNGTYESCTAMFGLTDKNNANYVTFTVGGTASPLPTIGDGLTPVLTVDDGTNVVECTLEVGFSDAESWLAYVGLPDDPEGLSVLPFGGKPGYLVPSFAATILSVGGVTGAAVGTVTPSVPLVPTLTLRVEPADPDLTADVDPTNLVFDVPEGIEAEFTTVIDELGGPTSPLGGQLVQLLSGGGCQGEQNDEPINIELAAALRELTNAPDAVWDQLSTTCDKIEGGLILRSYQLAIDSVGLAVTVTVDAAEPGPGPDPAPDPEPVTPKFTG